MYNTGGNDPVKASKTVRAGGEFLGLNTAAFLNQTFLLGGILCIAGSSAASLVWMPVAPSLRSDNQGCLQMLLHVPFWAESPLLENH